MQHRNSCVQFDAVTVRYPGTDRNAVDGVTLEIPEATFTVILGPSGCGKSTLLRTVNRLVVPASGRVRVRGADVAEQDPVALRRGIGYVIQAVGLFPHFTVAQNVGVVLSLLRWDAPRIAARVDELLALVDLDPDRYRARYPRELSGGEAQRVGVARAIAAEPELLLMDEPFGAVDAIVRGSLQEQIAAIARRLSATILFVTHDVDEALRLADRIVVMRAGKIEQDGTPLELLTQPAGSYVADLLDTRDVVRRLSLLRVRNAMRAADGAVDDSIEAQATLREALNAFLNGATRLGVRENGALAGVLEFEDVRRALRT